MTEERIYVDDGAGRITPKFLNARTAGKLYSARGIDPDGAQRLVEYAEAEQTALETERTAAVETQARAALKDGFIDEGLARIAAAVPDWDTLDKVEFVRSIWPALQPHATPAWTLARDIYVYARASIAKLNALNAAELALVVATDPAPFGPVEGADPGWPT